MARSSIVVALTLVAAACFHDNAPLPGDTAGSTTGSTTSATGDPTTGASTGASTTTGDTGSDASTLAPTGTGSATGGLTGDAGETTGEPSTGAPATATSMTTMSTAETGDSDCSAFPDYLGCIECCAQVQPGSLVYFKTLADCECNNIICQDVCKETLCSGIYPSADCFTCVVKEMQDSCANAASDACSKDRDCTQFVGCVINAGCQDKT